MKTVLRFFIVILCITSCNNHLEKKPKLVPQYERINLGSIEMDSTYKINFRMYNQGEGTLRIDTVSVSCDCTVPNFVQKEIKPNDSADLIISYTPVSVGPFDKAVVIKSNIDSIFTILKFYGTIQMQK